MWCGRRVSISPLASFCARDVRVDVKGAEPTGLVAFIKGERVSVGSKAP